MIRISWYPIHVFYLLNMEYHSNICRYVKVTSSLTNMGLQFTEKKFQWLDTHPHLKHKWDSTENWICIASSLWTSSWIILERKIHDKILKCIFEKMQLCQNSPFSLFVEVLVKLISPVTIETWEKNRGSHYIRFVLGSKQTRSESLRKSMTKREQRFSMVTENWY